MSFNTIPSRNNGQAIQYGWFDALRDAGILLENFIGTGFVAESQMTIVNNQSSAANVTGLVFDKTQVGAAFIDYFIVRKTSTENLTEAGVMTATYDDSIAGWILSVGPVAANNDSGVILTITTTGQIQYTSTNLTGTPVTSKMKFKARTLGV